MRSLSDALGLGPDGVTYRPPRTRRPSPVKRVKAWAWYRWGWGHRPQPDHQRH